ncbi:MAG: shikimate dehydrogenase [Elusimicrobia bacterium]|nr:shikimate dehydrogenase [Elusimicrobiota bacterium]
MDLDAVFHDAPAGAKLLGVIGHPLGHTLSPAMHMAAIKRLGLNAVYAKIEVKPDEWDDFLRQAKALPLHGFNVTLPYKEAIAKEARCRDASAYLGSVNTVLNNDGAWEGWSTDGPGFVKDIARCGIDLRDNRIVLLGAGGAARALLFTISFAALNPRKVTLFDTSLPKTQALIDDLKAVWKNPGVPADHKKGVFDVESAGDQERLKEAVRGCDVLINATPAGLKPSDTPAIDFSWLHKNLTVYDLIYHRETELMRAARDIGARAFDGLGMLVSQGALSFEKWFRTVPPADVMLAAAKAGLQNKS